MQLPLKIKWCGGETEEILLMLAAWHPLILIGSVPPLPEVPHGLALLPARVSRVWDLVDGEAISSVFGADGGAPPEGEFEFRCVDLSHAGGDASMLYDFYFKIYLPSTALGVKYTFSPYVYVEPLHDRLLRRRFAAFVGTFQRGELVGGCLLKRASPGRRTPRAERSNAPDACGEAGHVVLDLLAVGAQFEGTSLRRSLFERAAEWARSSGYSFLVTNPAQPLHKFSDGVDATWLEGSRTRPVYEDGPPSLLYCDPERCAHLGEDFYYFCLAGGAPALHYFANTAPGHTRAVPFLNSVEGVERRAYTRHARVRRAIEDAGIACTLVS